MTTAFKPSHVLFLADTLYSTLGGAEGIIWKMTQRLPRRGYRCSIATFAPRHEVAADRFDCPVHVFPTRRLYDWRVLGTAIRLARLIRSEQISIVHTFFTASDLLGALAAKLAGCPVVISSRRDMGFQRSDIHRIAYRVAAPLYDQVHAVCEQVRVAHIREDRLNPKKVVTVYNGVELDQIDQFRTMPLRELGLDDACKVITCVANIRRIKGLDVLIRTAAIVCRQQPEARFVVAGLVHDEEYYRSLLELTRTLGLEDRVRFLGVSAEVPSLLKASSVFYLPSRSEGMSNALVEAMACGLACVATRVGGNSEVIEDGVDGYLVPSDDPAAAAERILALLRDPMHAARMGQSARGTIQSKFTVQAMIDRITALYDGLLDKNSAPGAAMSGVDPVY